MDSKKRKLPDQLDSEIIPRKLQKFEVASEESSLGIDIDDADLF
jgi:hypothetical protein